MASSVQIGAKLPNSGPWPERLGIAAMAETLERAGFDSLWVGDHVLTPATPTTRYPYTDGGRMITPQDDPWYDAIVAMSAAAARTTRCEIGAGVLVLPLRHPVVAAKQIASLDAMSGGRIVLGVGAGWRREEFDALGIDFDRRGQALEDGVATMRSGWSGRLGDMIARPVPARPVPILVGGMSAPARRRVGTIGDGWYAVQPLARLDADEIARGVADIGKVRTQRAEPGRSRIVLRVTGSATGLDTVALGLKDLAAAGVTEIVVDVPWEEAYGPAEAFRLLAGAR